ncbi:hypothetical protein K402DRAFT_174346 [Aulographum hederae CBS 113979]|uniref:Uncharacterized protein n=1 Tax=Aulographum hederae CBS 113979 TaxID=1176131 RepID=A0A6G1HDI0_9PEZI|nr:hypothetical protein K402DRAFT_174346 [Aulographum hederae CBS 113979]
MKYRDQVFRLLRLRQYHLSPLFFVRLGMLLGPTWCLQHVSTTNTRLKRYLYVRNVVHATLNNICVRSPIFFLSCKTKFK